MDHTSRINQDYYEEEFPQTLDEDEMHRIFPTLESMEYLSNVDYSLNSPLLSDELDDFLYWAQYQGKVVRWNLTLWGKRLQGFGSGINWSNMIPSSSFHQDWGLFNCNHKVKDTDFVTLFRKSTKFARVTSVIPKTFIQGWIHKDINMTYTTHIPSNIMCWGNLYWELHKLTLILNASTTTEIKRLQQSTGCCSPINNNSPDVQEILTQNFGRVSISYGFLLFLDKKWLIDRNTLLMMKDTYIARFHTLLSMYQRLDTQYDESDWQTISTIYTTGDTILKDSGILGYKGIKLTEPLCNFRLCELAHEYRKLVPQFPAFGLHLDKSIKELQSDHQVIVTPLRDLIWAMCNVDLILVVFSSFRHWGHPYINYQSGLAKLHKQVTMRKDIDIEYADLLGSDLAFLVLESQFKLTQKWFVEIESLDVDHILYMDIENGTWPSLTTIRQMEGKWNKLPLMKCFEIPDLIDPSIIYSDKSHSMNRSEIAAWIYSNPGKAIPTRKVLTTLLSRPSTNWPEFLQRVNDDGLDTDSLAIGLKAKEREIKDDGRYFTLMTWDLREYFVVTEYLIKQFFVPLFAGLTMADDLTTVIKKMMDNTIGQGGSDYKKICIANHFDYEKWNNHQRAESNGPVFKVMGQFLGYPKLISRTHEMFQQSWIYYKDRGDQLYIEGDSIHSKEGLYAWNGQAGGLEGLRQKGWSILNLLVISRESKKRNTSVKCLAQGDNQVIFTSYETEPARTENELIKNLEHIVENNGSIVTFISEGANKLGLLINHDETIQSADYMIYGKVPVFRGNFRNLETKRWSRVTCVSNDQLPTLASVLSSVVSNALTVSHSSIGPLNPIYHYNLLGNLAIEIICYHNPALRGPVPGISGECKEFAKPSTRIVTMYLDPSLGGIAGVSLTRFLIRMFPDPITEGLSFLKLIHDTTDNPRIQGLMVSMGNPRLAAMDIDAFKKLLEDPASINIVHGISAATMIKNLIRETLLEEADNIENEIVKDAATFSRREEQAFTNFLMGIKPLFPRFLAEFKSSTYFGITDSIIGLFVNSRTIRNQFKRNLSRKVDSAIVKSEIHGIKSLISIADLVPIYDIWFCSTDHAARLRKISWGEEEFPENLFISLLINDGLQNIFESSGNGHAYLGSTTSETTSILQPWEREGKVPLIQRAAKLRDSIGWFIEPNSPLAQSIIDNLNALTGEDWNTTQIRGLKSGSALHRYRTTRQSAGGYAAQNPAPLTRILSTTNTMSAIGDVNYNFMFQSLLLYAQMTTGEVHQNKPEKAVFHFHISCIGCLTLIDTIKLQCESKYVYEDVHNRLNKWKPDGVPWSETRQYLTIQLGDWDNIHPFQKSYAVGLIESFVHTDLYWSGNKHVDDSSIFPLSLRGKLDVKAYSMGLLEGTLRATALYVSTRGSIAYGRMNISKLLGPVDIAYQVLSKNTGLVNLWRGVEFEEVFRTIPHKISPQYPSTDIDISRLGLNYLRFLSSIYLEKRTRILKNTGIWIFSDINDVRTIGCLGISGKIIDILGSIKLKKPLKELLKAYRLTVHQLRSKSQSINLEDVMEFTADFRFVNQEIRHALKSVYRHQNLTPIDYRLFGTWGDESYGYVKSGLVEYQSLKHKTCPNDFIEIQNPLISGLRTFQCATGAHYKIRSILKDHKITCTDALVGGDGSGGIGSAILRYSPSSRLIFNSLLELSGVNLRGSDPGPPSAINSIPHIRGRCVNLTSAWHNPSDLSSWDTWCYFKSLIDEHRLTVDLIILDMELRDIKISNAIEFNLANFVSDLHTKCSVIYKTYWKHLSSGRGVLEHVGKLFSNVWIMTTQFSSSQTSEIYVLMSGKKTTVCPRVFPILDHKTCSLVGIPSNQPDLAEFNRAITLKKIDMLSGVPTNFRVDPKTNLQNLFDVFGLKATYNQTILSRLSNGYRTNNLEDSFFILIMGLQGILDIITGRETPANPPSNTKVEYIGSFITGHMLWYSWVTELHHINKRSMHFIRDLFPFSWGQESHTIQDIRDGHSIKLYNSRWTIGQDIGVRKYIHLDNKMALIGQIIRAFDLLCNPYGTTLNIGQINSKIKTMHSFINVSNFNRRTGLIDLYKLDYDIKAACSGPRGQVISATMTSGDAQRSWRN